MGALVTSELAEGRATITMDDGKVNALSPTMLAELHAAFEAVGGEGVPVVLRGRQGIFSAGFDLKVLTGGTTAAADLLEQGFTLAERMLSLPSPVIVACPGHAIAMGLFLVLSGDYRIGVAGPYRLTANEVAIGMTLPRTAIEICRSRVAPGAFDRVVLLSEVFSPAAAAAAGILDRVVEAAGLDAAVDEVATTTAGLNMAAHRATKLRVREGLLERLREAIGADDAEFRGRLTRTGT